MANFVQAVINGFDIDGAAFKVEILGPGEPEAPIELQSGYPLAVIKWQRDEGALFTSTMMQSECEINFIDTGNAASIITMLAGAADNTISVRVVYDESPDVLFWCGIIMPDTLTVELSKDPKNVNIRATDGFSMLSQSTAHASIATTQEFGKVFYAMMNTLVCYQDNYPAANQSVFYQPYFTVTGATNQVFKDVIFERVFDNDYDYLNAVLNDLGLYIVHTNGYYYMISVFDVAGGSFSGTWYKESSITAISSSTLSYSTITSKTDVGGIRRWTRPFNDILMTYNQSADRMRFEEDEHSTGSSHTITMHSITCENMYPFHKFTITGQALLEASSPDLSDFRQIDFEIKYGSKYMLWDGSWTTTATWLEIPIDFQGINADSIGVFTFFGNLYAAYTSGSYLFTIKARFQSEDTTPAGNLAREFCRMDIVLENQDEDEFTHSTGTTKPILETEIYFVTRNVLAIDSMYSTGLASYIGTLWTDGTDSGYLHELRAAALEDALLDPQEVIEAYIDKLAGPASYYNVATHKCVPVSLEMDMATKEGNIVGFKVGTI